LETAEARRKREQWRPRLLRELAREFTHCSLADLEAAVYPERHGDWVVADGHLPRP